VTPADGSVMGVDMSQLLGYAFATIKALRDEVRELEREVHRLQQRGGGGQ